LTEKNTEDGLFFPETPDAKEVPHASFLPEKQQTRARLTWRQELGGPGLRAFQFKGGGVSGQANVCVRFRSKEFRLGNSAVELHTRSHVSCQSFRRQWTAVELADKSLSLVCLCFLGGWSRDGEQLLQW